MQQDEHMRVYLRWLREVDYELWTAAFWSHVDAHVDENAWTEGHSL